MSESRLVAGDRVVLVEDAKNRDMSPDDDGYPRLVSHWGEGEIKDVRSSGAGGGSTLHRYGVHWPKRGTFLWMRGRDLMTPEEASCASLPCETCGRYTRMVGADGSQACRRHGGRRFAC